MLGEGERHEDERSLQRVKDEEEIPENFRVGGRCQKGEDPRQAHDDGDFDVDAVAPSVGAASNLPGAVLYVRYMYGRQNEHDEIGGEDQRNGEGEEQEQRPPVRDPTETVAVARSRRRRRRGNDVDDHRRDDDDHRRTPGVHRVPDEATPLTLRGSPVHRAGEDPADVQRHDVHPRERTQEGQVSADGEDEADRRRSASGIERVKGDTDQEGELGDQKTTRQRDDAFAGDVT